MQLQRHVMRSIGIGLTDVGQARLVNEDSLLVDNELGLYIVSDGMGGHAAGDVASREAVAAVAAYVRGEAKLIERIRRGLANEALLPPIAVTAVAEACRAVYQKSVSQPELSGMGCTLTVLLMGRQGAAMAHVGDSRLYLHRHDQVRQLSVDHSLAQELVRLGLITALEAEFVPEGNSLTRAIGVRESVSVDDLLIPLEPGDTFLLCSDGLWDHFRDAQELDDFLCEEDMRVSARALIDFANSSGGYDNITAIVVRVEEEDEDTDEATCAPRVCSSDIATTLKIHRAKTADLPAQ